MNELLNKLSSYNLFNNLVPGTVFVFLVSKPIHHDLIPQNIVVELFLYYFAGLVIGRFGSLVIEPMLRKSSFLKLSSYKEFVESSKKDEKIEILLEAANLYRTICSMLVLLFSVRLYMLAAAAFPFLIEWRDAIVGALLLALFALAYKKQSSYVSMRVKANM